MKSTLDNLQRQLLEAFFRREKAFFLTGGGALAGFYLGHRTTKDLDLFTTEARLDEGVAALREVASELGATVKATQTELDFRRFLLSREGEGAMVDLVRDLAPQLHEEKELIDGIRVDPLDEIFANKLCTVLARCEVRDLVDLLALDRAGFKVEERIDQAALKDGGLTPAQLAWVLSQIQIGDDAQLPGGVSVEELRGFLKELEARLTRMALPAG